MGEVFILLETNPPPGRGFQIIKRDFRPTGTHIGIRFPHVVSGRKVISELKLFCRRLGTSIKEISAESAEGGKFSIDRGRIHGVSADAGGVGSLIGSIEVSRGWAGRGPISWYPESVSQAQVLFDSREGGNCTN